jgi:hypothetical protein
MSESILFTTYLHDLMTAHKVSADHLQHELDYRTSITVRSWLGGRSRPSLWALPAIAKVLRADPVEMVTGWVIDQLPEMEAILRIELLEPRGSKFPRSDDLALRAPRPLKWDPSW